MTFLDRPPQRVLVAQREAEEEIEAKSRSHSAANLRPAALHRLCYAHRQKDVEMEALRDYLANHEDPDSGRPLFKPMITRGPKAPTAADGAAANGGGGGGGGGGGDGGGDEGGVPADERQTNGLQAHITGDSRLVTGEALHTQRVKSRRSREALRQEANNALREKQNGAYARGASGEMVREMRERRMREMFEALDSKGEGVLDGQTLATSLTSLPPDVANALRPKISTFRNEYLAFSDFRDLIQRSLATHAPNGPRCSFLPTRGVTSIHGNTQAQRLRAQQAECSFHPEVNARSQKLAEAKRDPSKPITEHLTERNAEYAARRVAAQQAAINEEDKHCTFQPESYTRAHKPRDTSPSDVDLPRARGPRVHSRPPPESTVEREVRGREIEDARFTSDPRSAATVPCVSSTLRC